MAWQTKIPARLIDFENKVHPNTNYCIGVKMISSGGGAGTWVRIDEYDNVVDIDKEVYFKRHPIYSAIKTVQMDGNQIMVKIPKFYIRTDEGQRFWIAPDPTNEELSIEENTNAVNDLKKRGFRLHPAFYKKNGDEVSHFFVGAYQGSIYGQVCCSEPNQFPTANLSFKAWKDACAGRNSGGSTGYHMWTIYEMSAITILALIESCTTDFQTYYGEGRVTATGMGMTSDNSVISASYRDIMGLWGNAWQYIDGIVSDTSDTIQIWSNDGKQTWMTTTTKVASKATESTTWVDGKSCGYFTSLNITVGQKYNFNDVFVPDFTTLINGQSNGSFSDFVYGRTTGVEKKVCCVGGDFISGVGAGLFSYNFDVGENDAFDNITTRLASY